MKLVQLRVAVKGRTCSVCICNGNYQETCAESMLDRTSFVTMVFSKTVAQNRIKSILLFLCRSDQ